MDKFQDGFFAFRDSTKPLYIVGAGRQEGFTVSVVGDKILIAPVRAGSRLKFHENDADGVVFTVVPEGSDSEPELTGEKLASHAVQVL